CSGPLDCSRKLIVIRASASTTSVPSTIRRLSALVLREESARGEPGRRTLRPSTADLAVRLRGTERLSLAPSQEGVRRFQYLRPLRRGRARALGGVASNPASAPP